VLRMREGRDLVATTDAFVEHRHFHRDLLTPAEAGARLAAANLSDLAAMAAEPRWALLSLVVPKSWTQAECALLQRACSRTLTADGAAIVGGNLAATDGAFTATLTLLGDFERGAAWTRAGARPGDVLAVTGAPGSAAAFIALSHWGNPPTRARVPPPIVERVVVPVSRVPLARALAASGGVRAAIDISDGLAADLAHLCEAGGVGARVDEASLPADESMHQAARLLSAFSGQERGPLPGSEAEMLTRLQLGASDDYELLLAIDPARWPDCERIAGEARVPLTRVGEVLAGNTCFLKATSGAESTLDAPGWDHFRDR